MNTGPLSACRPATAARPLVFVHIPKTAGTSLLAIIDRIYGFDSMYWCEKGPGCSIEAFSAMTARERARYRVLAGHFHFDFRVLFPGSPAVMTFLRDPVERVLSLYSYVRTAPAHPLYERAQRPGFSLRVMREEGELGDNGQVRFLARQVKGVPCTRAMLDEAKENLAEGCTSFGLAERFDESLGLFERELGWPRTSAVRFNVTPARLKRSEASAEDLALIEETNRLDSELYEFAAGVFEGRVGRASGSR